MSRAPVILGIWPNGSPTFSADAVVVNFADHTIRRGSKGGYVRPGIHRLATLLLSAQGRLVSHSSLHEWAYGEREDGGPSDRSVRDVIYREVRPVMSALGLDVRAVHGRGYLLTAQSGGGD